MVAVSSSSSSSRLLLRGQALPASSTFVGSFLGGSTCFRIMSQSCASDDFSLPSDGDGHEEHIGRQSLGLQRQKQVEFGYDKTHSTVGVLCLSNPLVSLYLSL